MWRMHFSLQTNQALKKIKTTRLKTPVLFHSDSNRRCFFFPLGDVSSQLGVRFFFHPEAFGALPNNSWLRYAVYIINYTDLETLQIFYKKSFSCAFLVATLSTIGVRMMMF